MKRILLPKREGYFLPLHFLAIAIVLIFSHSLTAQTRIDLAADVTQTQVVRSDAQQLKIVYSFDQMQSFDVRTPAGDFHELILSKGYSVGALGTPRLPAAKDLIEIPFGAEVEVQVRNFTMREYQLSDLGLTQRIMPVQPSLRKDMEAEDVPFEYLPEAYLQNRFSDQELAQVEVLGVLRGMRLARLTVAPVRYNPVAGTLQVYNDIEVEINFKGADAQLTEYVKASTFSPYFDVLYSQILNTPDTRNVFDNHPDLTKNPIKMLVVSHREFEATLQPYLEWKTQQGFFLTVAYTDVIGTTAAAIQSWIHAQYNAATPDNPAPTFLVLVGDGSKVPASAIGSSSNVVTDLYYASVDGDYFPEMYYGRLSARNPQELQNQIDKILYYERYEFTDPTYLDKVTLIAGADGSWNPVIGQPTVHYGTQNYFNAANGFSTVNTYLTNYTGCYDNERISVSLINFTAHCSPTSWSSPTLNVIDVHNMTNTGKYPLAIGNCCQSALFSHTESIGEAWLRAANKGAVAYVGSAPNSYWFEDFYWAVGAFPITGNNGGYVPTAAETTLGAYDAPFVSDYLAVAALKFVGNLAVTVVDVMNYPSHSSPLYYWQAYHTFGDPSTYIYLTQGSDNVVSHMPIVPIGLDTYTVEALPGSYVAISKDGVLHGAAFVGPDGEVEVPIEPIMDGGDVLIVVTKAQYKPYMETVPAAALEGPFVVLGSYEVNNDQQAFVYGQTATIHVTVKNVGADDATGITGTLYIDNPYFSVVNTEAVTFGDVDAGETGNTATVQNAFTIALSAEVPDQYQATFVLTLTDGQDQWQSNLRATALAPQIVFEQLTIQDSGQLNPGVLDPGESAQMIIGLKNVGHAATQEVLVQAASSSPWLSLQQQGVTLPAMEPAATATASFAVSASPGTPPETPAQINFAATTGLYTFTDSRQIIIGQAPVYDGGDIPTTFNTAPTTAQSAQEPGILNVTIPQGAVITGVDVEYKMTAQGGAWTSEQRSFIRCVSPGGTTESQVYSGSGNSAGTQTYSRTGLNIANNVEGGGEITFELHAFRTWGGSGSNTQYNFVGNNTWKVIVHYELQGYSATFNVTDTQGAPIADAVLTFDGYVQTPGVYHVSGLEDGIFDWSLEKDGYDTKTGQVNIDGQNVVVDVVMSLTPITYKVNFLINDNFGNVVNGATITIGGDTHDAGAYSIPGLVSGMHSFSITHADYHPFTGSILITNQDVDVNVTLIHITTDLNDVAQEPSFLVYPNPTRGKLTLAINGHNKGFTYTLSNYQGQVIRKQSWDHTNPIEQFNIDLEGFAAGIYYLRLDFENHTHIEKIVLK